MRHRAWIAAAAIAATFAVGAGLAQADTVTSDYPTSTDARAFAGSVGGWQSAKFDAGLTCILKPLTCPIVTNLWQSSGGASGDGYIRTSIGSLTGVASDSYGVWASPEFTYNGAQGQEPTSLTISLDRKLANADLVDANLGNSVQYYVQVIDASNGNVVAQPIDGKTATVASRWTSIGPATVDPSKLQIGHSYLVAIATEFKTGVRVIPGGSAGYDNVDLKARFTPPPTTGGGGGGGGGGPRFLTWHRLIVKSNCPKSIQTHTCLIHLVTYLRGFSGTHPTLAKTVRRRGHHSKTISLRVRPTNNTWARSLVAHNRRLHATQTIKAHHRSRTKNVALKVVAFKKP